MTKKSKKQSLPEGTINICVNVPIKLKKDIFNTACKNDMRASEYCRIVLQDAVDKGLLIKKTITLKAK